MIREKGSGTVFELSVKPNSKRVNIKVKKGVVHLSVTRPPVKNQANREIVAVLSQFFGCPVSIEKSMPGYKKLIMVEGMNPEQVKNRLGMK